MADRDRALAGRVKQVDVAARAGVTRATVSRVLNNHTDRFSVRPEVRRRVLEAAAALGYQPDLMARALRRRRSGLVGLLGGQTPATFSAQLLAGLSEGLAPRGFLVSPSFVTAEGPAHALPWWRLDGAVVSGAVSQDDVVGVERAALPYVSVNCWCGTCGSAVLMDDADGTRQALRHLLELGHRRIAYANATSPMGRHPSVTARHRAYLRVLREQGLRPLPWHDRPVDEPPDGFVAEVVRGHRATAILAYSHHLAVMLLRALQLAGLRVPGDVSLVAFNDEYPVSQLCPALTVLRLDGLAAGRAAAELLMARLDAPALAPARRLLPECLVVRESTGPALA